MIKLLFYFVAYQPDSEHGYRVKTRYIASGMFESIEQRNPCPRKFWLASLSAKNSLSGFQI